MIGILRQKSPANIIVLLVFGLLLKLPLFIHPVNTRLSEDDGQLYAWLLEQFPPDNAVMSSAISFFLLYIQALLINYLVNSFRMISRQNYLPAASFLLITSFLPEWNYLSSPLVVNTLVIWMFISLFSLYNAASIRKSIYNIGLLAGISSYIYFSSAIFVVCILIGLMILRPFRIQEILLFILGCITPYYFYGIYLYLTDSFELDHFIPRVTIDSPEIKNSIWLAASTVMLTVPFLLGGYFVQVQLRKMLIQVRKNWSIMLLYLVLAFFAPFVNSQDSFTTWVLIAAPFAAFHAAAYFYAPRRFLVSLLFFAGAGFVILQQYGTGIWSLTE